MGRDQRHLCQDDGSAVLSKSLAWGFGPPPQLAMQAVGGTGLVASQYGNEKYLRFLATVFALAIWFMFFKKIFIIFLFYSAYKLDDKY